MFHWVLSTEASHCGLSRVSGDFFLVFNFFCVFFLQSLVFFFMFSESFDQNFGFVHCFFFVLLSTFFTWSFWPFFCVKKRPNRQQKVNFPDFPFCKVLNRKKKDRRATDNEHQSDCPDGCADELRRRAPDSDHHKKKTEKGNGP